MNHKLLFSNIFGPKQTLENAVAQQPHQENYNHGPQQDINIIKNKDVDSAIKEIKTSEQPNPKHEDTNSLLSSQVRTLRKQNPRNVPPLPIILKPKSQKKQKQKQHKTSILLGSPDQDDIEFQKSNSKTGYKGKPLVWQLELKYMHDMKSFLSSPCPQGLLMECTVFRFREKTGDRFECRLSLGNQLMMSAHTEGFHITPHYSIQYARNNSNCYLGKLKSNFIGNEHTIYGSESEWANRGQFRDSLGVVEYASRMSTGPRQIKVYLPKVDDITGEANPFKKSTEDIINKWNSGDKAGMYRWHNKQPVWNESLKKSLGLNTYYLDFNGRGEMDSVKNFQLVDDMDVKAMLARNFLDEPNENQPASLLSKMSYQSIKTNAQAALNGSDSEAYDESDEENKASEQMFFENPHANPESIPFRKKISSIAIRILGKQADLQEQVVPAESLNHLEPPTLNSPTKTHGPQPLQSQSQQLQQQKEKEKEISPPAPMQTSQTIIPNMSQSSKVIKKKGKPQVLRINLAHIHDMRAFLNSPCPVGFVMQCTVYRDRLLSGHKFQCRMNQEVLPVMSAHTEGIHLTPHFSIHCDHPGSQFCLGKLKANFAGTEFTIFGKEKGWRHSEEFTDNLGVVVYNSRIEFKKKPRQIKAYFPETDDVTGEVQSFKGKDNLIDKWNSGNKAGIYEWFNKPPKWSEKWGAFILDFGGRVTKASVKNFQLVDNEDDEHVFLQFGRVARDEFNLDFRWPITPYQAFAVALTSFAHKKIIE